MAKVLTDFEFIARGKSGKYPWDEWLDGQVWQLKIDEDFKAKNTNSFRATVAIAARRRGLKVRTAVIGDTLVIKARPKEEAATP